MARPKPSKAWHFSPYPSQWTQIPQGKRRTRTQESSPLCWGVTVGASLLTLPHHAQTSHPTSCPQTHQQGRGRLTEEQKQLPGHIGGGHHRHCLSRAGPRPLGSRDICS